MHIISHRRATGQSQRRQQGPSVQNNAKFAKVFS